MKTIKRTKIFNAHPQEVFDLLDNPGITGRHLLVSSLPLCGAKLQLEYLSAQKTGLHTAYRWRGKVLWWTLDFTLLVTKWLPGRVKTWQTIGCPRLILYEWVDLHLDVVRALEGSTAHLSFTYEQPNGLSRKLLCYWLGSWYGTWCLNHMLEAAEQELKSTPLTKKTRTAWMPKST